MYEMKFGRFVGQDIRDVPRWYLEWLTRTETIDAIVRRAAGDVLGNRAIAEWYTVLPQRPKWEPGLYEVK